MEPNRFAWRSRRMDVTVELNCDKCGSANLSLPAAEDEQSAIRCNDCGEQHGTLAELRAELLARAMEHSAQALRRGLERLP